MEYSRVWDSFALLLLVHKRSWFVSPLLVPRFPLPSKALGTRTADDEPAQSELSSIQLFLGPVPNFPEVRCLDKMIEKRCDGECAVSQASHVMLERFPIQIEQPMLMISAVGPRFNKKKWYHKAIRRDEILERAAWREPPCRCRYMQVGLRLTQAYGRSRKGEGGLDLAAVIAGFVEAMQVLLFPSR